jgi:sulfite exporter TauE/SafE
MCGPLALALPVGNLSKGEKVKARFLFLFGRWLVYGLMGALVGSMGQGISWLGGQRYLLFGATLILFVLVSGWNMDWAVSLRNYFRQASLQQRESNPNAAFFLLGLGNGLLPCGLVYGALTQSALSSNGLYGFLLMLVFGIVSSWWHFVLMTNVQIRLPKNALLQAFASPRGSLAVVVVFMVLRIFHSPQQLPDPQKVNGSRPNEVSCGQLH